MTVDSVIIEKVVPMLYELIDQLLNTEGHDKKLVVAAKKLLPAKYKNSFANEKGKAWTS
jgi:hypothetical protein